MEETFWLLEDDENLDFLSRLQLNPNRHHRPTSPARNGVEIIPLQHTYEDIIAFAICCMPTVWTLLIAETWCLEKN